MAEVEVGGALPLHPQHGGADGAGLAGHNGGRPLRRIARAAGGGYLHLPLPGPVHAQGLHQLHVLDFPGIGQQAGPTAAAGEGQGGQAGQQQGLLCVSFLIPPVSGFSGPPGAALPGAGAGGTPRAPPPAPRHSRRRGSGRTRRSSQCPPDGSPAPTGRPPRRTGPPRWPAGPAGTARCAGRPPPPERAWCTPPPPQWPQQ